MPFFQQVCCVAGMYRVGGQIRNPAVTVLDIVPPEERHERGTHVLNAAESLRKIWPILHGLKMRFAKWVLGFNLQVQQPALA